MTDNKTLEPGATANARHLDSLAKTAAEIWPQTLRHGFFGEVGFEVKIQDGTIQQVVTRVNRKVK
jgi:hypothetical protein